MFTLFHFRDARMVQYMHINRIQYNMYISISVDIEKAFDKIQYHLKLKTPKILGI
jgi:hypothetical protein